MQRYVNSTYVTNEKRSSYIFISTAMLRFGDWVKNLARILSTIDNLARYLKHFLGV